VCNTAGGALSAVPVLSRTSGFQGTRAGARSAGPGAPLSPVDPPRGWEGRVIDTQPDVLPGMPGSAKCVQRFDDSRDSAIHITYRSSLRSSSLREPRDPLLKVVYWLCFVSGKKEGVKGVWLKWCGESGRGAARGRATLPGRPRGSRCTKRVLIFRGSMMILPQVHLRKPCYDFYFL
jgi:hypothetical protein